MQSEHAWAILLGNGSGWVKVGEIAGLEWGGGGGPAGRV